MPTAPHPPTLSNLTQGERLLTARRRASLTQAELCRRVGIKRRDLQRIEGNQMPKERREKLIHAQPKLAALIDSIEDLRPCETCHLSRLRSGITLEQIGKLAGYTKFWVGQMERGAVPPDPLFDWWRQPRADIARLFDTL